MANENKSLQQNNGSETTNAGDKQICGDENENVNKLNDLVADLCTSTTSTLAVGGSGEYVHREDNVYTLNTATTTTQQTPAQNSTFSFKHFLNSTTTAAAPTSSIVVSLDTQISNTAEVNSTTTNVYTNSLRTSTGAKPKVPQSSSASATSISSLIGSSSQDSSVSSSSAIKMKRSPRFSSFDSQASLAEHASVVSEASSSGAIGGVDLNNSRHVRLCPGGSLISENNDWFTNDYDRQQFVPRSISNYDMPVPPSSPRRLMRGNSAARDGRPNRLQSYNSNSNSSKLRLDLPIENMHNNNTASGSRPVSNNANEFGPTAAGASGLPDFVQDHWMVSPPNSPICDIIDDSASLSANAQLNMNGADVASGGGGGGGVKMLPDFLSDGPIIHSSQRWADVTVGLPSDSFCSPETSAMSMQLSQLRIENEKLQFELTESRNSLDEQTKRADNLEAQLQRERKETLATDKNEQRASPNEVCRLKQQIISLSTQMETLRRENELLREDGAVGGCNSMKCDRQTNSNDISAENVCRTHNRTQQISRDLLRAAENAEQNLRQLLSGVNNLRQMAADIGNSEARLDDASPDIYSDYLDDLDEDYGENPGGPAL